MKKKHAKHNEDVCDYLLLKDDFNDWVITTAFYSALHYVQYEMFPLIEQGNTFSDFNTYYAKVIKPKNRKINKHTATVNLVKSHIPSASSYYRWLHDACMNARYVDYKVSQSKARQARNFLRELKYHLKKITPATTA